MVGYIFNGEGLPKTPQELERMREMARAMTRRSRTPQNVGEGIASIGDAILYRSLTGKADKAENAGIASANDAFSSLFSSPDVPPVDTAAVPPVDTTTKVDPASTAVVPPQVSTIKSPQDAVDAASANPKYDLRSGIRAAAKTLGVDPTDLATAISYETAGTFDPTKKGPTTQWGQHRGLIQFGEPQAEQFGVNWDDPLQSQLGPDGAVVKYLQSTGVKPGMGLLDIYSAINAGGVNRYDASDANNGGAPGTVADKVNNQMEGHRQKALALFADQAQQADPFTAQPGLTAQDQVPVVPVPDGFQQPDPLAMQEQPVEVADNSNYFPPAPRKKVADALQRLDPQKAIEILNNPYLPAGKKAVIQSLLKQQYDADNMAREQELKQADPKYQLDLEKGRLELGNLKSPPKARNLTDDEEKAMGLDPSGVYQAMPDNTIKTVREPGKAIDAVNAEKAQIELENLKSPKGKWNKLNDTTIVNDVTGETKTLDTGKTDFRFPGNSPEAAALNGLIDGGQLTIQQAQQIAAGKSITGPNGEILFATPEALIGANQQRQAQQDGGIDIFAGEQPVIPGDKPANAIPAVNQRTDGMIPLTQPKVTLDERKAATFADRVTTSGAIIDEMGMKGTNATDKALSDWMPFGTGDYLTSNDFKKVDQAKRDFINSVLRRESGAVISDSEFDNANKQYFPHPDDPPELVKQKAANRQLVIDGLKRDAGPTYKGVQKEKMPGVPEGVDPGIWEHMTPEERKLWQN